MKSIEDVQADVTEPQPSTRSSPTRGYHSNQTMVDLGAVGLRSYIASRTGVAAIGHRCPRARRRCMGIVAGFVDHADGV